ncbi:MAG TPA: PilZ domain-containing protein [Candidatus Brocadiia bacterium]|nr:PilZ domain-containing protein [Candidatus Brocadiia bacterium]
MSKGQPRKGSARREDKREKLRYDSVNLLYYEDFDETGEGTLSGLGSTINISAGGILVRTTIPLRLHSKVSVDMFTHFQRKIRAICEVEHVTKTGDASYANGMRFLAISRGDVEYLETRFPAAKFGETEAKTSQEK